MIRETLEAMMRRDSSLEALVEKALEELLACETPEERKALFIRWNKLQLWRQR